MIRSMTGFGKSTAKLDGRNVSIEIRTLNSKQLDANIRVPQQFRDKEAEIRSEIARVLERGKVDFTISVDTDAESCDFSINLPLAKKYYNEIKQLAKDLNEQIGTEIIPTLLKIPEVTKVGREVLEPKDWEILNTAINQALELTDTFRSLEGELLGKDMISHIEQILQQLEIVEPLEAARISNLRERFHRNQAEFLEKGTKLEKFDENRFEQEIFWYLERLDISEEKMRLRKHCDYFIETLKSNESNGRKLGFITQEIGREINTLGSKAYDADIQMIVVQMKDELEKIKEQVSNVL